MKNMLEREMVMVLEDEMKRLSSADPKVAQVMETSLLKVVLRLELDGFDRQMALAGVTDYVGFCCNLALLGVKDGLPTDVVSFYEGAHAFVEDLIGTSDRRALAA